MFTAKDMHNKLQSLNVCNGIDEWIEDVLYEKFVQFGSNAAIDVKDIVWKGWTKDGFIFEMAARGFFVEYKSDQRDGDYYLVTYPPQGR